MSIVANTRIFAAPLTGVQRYLAEVLRHLPDDVATLAPTHRAAGIGGHIWEQCGLPLQAGGALLWSPSNTGPLIRRHQVVTIHDVIPLDHPEWMAWKFAAWYRFLLPRLVRRARHVIAISEFTRRRLLATTQVKPENITVIPNGVDEKFAPQTPAVAAAAAAALALPSPHYLLTVGSLAPRKNLRRLLLAWNEILDRVDPDVWLVVAGAKGSPEVFARGTGVETLPPRVHLTGHVPDDLLPGLYAGARGFAYVSEYEGFGLPPLEAMACGVPVLVSNSTAFPEVVSGNGLYADPSDVGSIARGLLRLLEGGETAQRLAALGQARARQFSWHRTAAMTLRVLQNASGPKL